MKSIRRIVGLGAAALLLASGLAYAAGMFPGLPIVGGSSYCSGYSTGPSGQICNVTVPAGPSALTGNELIPADTGLPQGQSPQTVAIPTSRLGAGPTTYVVPVTTDSVTITNTTRRLNINPAGTIAAFTLVFPAASTLTQADGQLFGFCTTQIVTTLTVTEGAGTTVLNKPTAMLVPVATGAGSCVEWQYRLSNTTWYRVQ